MTDRVLDLGRRALLTGVARYRCCLVALLVVCSGTGDRAQAGKVVLKNGFELHGTPVRVPGMTSKISRSNLGQNVPQTPFWMVDDGVRRFFVHRQNVRPGPDAVEDFDDSSRYVAFTLTPLLNRKDAIPAEIGAFVDAAPWDQFGHSRVTLRTPRGEEHILLSLTRLDPRTLTVKSTSHDWDFGLDTRSFPQERLRSILRTAIDPRNPDDRLAVVRFFLQAEQLAGARAELAAIAEEFPELRSRVEELQRELLERYGLEALAEIVRRRRAGQHEFARFLARRTLQEELSASTLRDVQLILDEYEDAERQMAAARMWLGNLQAELEPEEARRFAIIRAALEPELHVESLPRLIPFLQSVENPQVPAAEKVALACSGWLLGASQARTELKEALALWDARFAVLEYLHPVADRGDRKAIIDRLRHLEGFSVATLAQMVPLLPMPQGTTGDTAARIESFELPPAVDGEATVRYSVLLPPEYNPAHVYPTLVALRAEGRTVDETLAFWGGRVGEPGWSQRRGYIVLAPEYAPAASGTYDYGRAAHEIVLRALCDARQRFRIDSSRVFLTGHGMGGDAAYDLGLSHPDFWAGVIPFTGRFQHAARLLATNAPELPFYVVGGERDRNTLQINDVPFSARMSRGYDFIYCEYKDRGFESYSEELPRLFDWMDRQRRPAVVRELKHAIVRDFDNRVGWLKWVDLPADLSQPVAWGQEERSPRPKTIAAKIPTPQTIFVSSQPGKHTVLWLAPDLVDYDERIKISINSTRPFNGFLEPDPEVLLEDLRERGDRERLYWSKLSF